VVAAYDGIERIDFDIGKFVGSVFSEEVIAKNGEYLYVDTPFFKPGDVGMCFPGQVVFDVEPLHGGGQDIIVGIGHDGFPVKAFVGLAEGQGRKKQQGRNKNGVFAHAFVLTGKFTKYA
jgi:hypothetical protein